MSGVCSLQVGFLRAKPAHVGKAATGVAASCDQFRGDRNRNFLGRDGADVQADRGMHALEQMRGQALLLAVF